MMNTKNNNLLVSGAIVFKDYHGNRRWLLIKNPKDGRWEIPKITVRRGESSVRASLRMTGEMAGMNTRVLEEAGRTSGATVINGKSIPVKYYYYLLVYKSGGETIGFEAFEWMDYAKAIKKVDLKREKDMLRGAKTVLREWEKERKKKKS